MNDEPLARIDAALDNIRPAANEYVKSLHLLKIQTTKDNYGPVLAFLTRLQKESGEMAPLFLIAMVGEGYPLATAKQLNTLFGWPASVDALLNREYLKDVEVSA